MSESTQGIAIDTNSKSVVLVGSELIHTLFQGLGRKAYTLKDFNNVAITILKRCAPEHGLDIDKLDLSEWCLATSTLEDNDALLSYLVDSRAEVTNFVFGDGVSPSNQKKEVLH